MTDQEILRLVEAGRYFVLSGTNTYIGTSAANLPPVQSYSSRKSFYFQTTNSNTGASTVNLDGAGAISLVKLGTTPLAASDLLAGGIIQAVYDGTNFQVIGGISAGGAVINDTTASTTTVYSSSKTQGEIDTLSAEIASILPAGNALFLYYNFT